MMSNLVHIKYVLYCHQYVCLAFIWKSRFVLEEKSKGRCGKGCGHKKGSNGVAYDDSYCDKFEGFTRQQFEKSAKMLHFLELLPSEALKMFPVTAMHHSLHHLSPFVAAPFPHPH